MNPTFLTKLPLFLALLAPVATTYANINELNIEPGAQYFEIRGPAGLDVSPFHYLVIGDGEDGNSGVIETVIPLQGSVPDNGFYLAAEPAFGQSGRADFTTEINFETDDNVTHLVVGGFTGSVGMDLDTNDDCQIDVSVPWGPVIDGIALVKEHNPPVSTECHYGGNALGDELGFPVVEYGGLSPQLSAVPDGSNNYRTGTMTAGDQNSFYVYDNFADGRIDDLSPASWTSSGTINVNESGGLDFVSSNATGASATTEAGPLPNRSDWSIRARLTLNEVLGVGFAGVGVSDARWASTFANDQAFGVGEWFESTQQDIGNVVGKEIVVQFRATAETLEGHFWLSEAPGEFISIERSNKGNASFEPLLINNGVDETFHEVWMSTEPLPLPLSGTSMFADINGDRELDSNDIDLLSELVRSESDRMIYDVDGNGTLDSEDRRIWVEEAIRTQFGDANLDQSVDFADFLHVSANFGSTGGWSEGDFDGDGWVRFPDFLFLSKNFSGNAEVAPVPEPSASHLGCFVLGVLIWNRRNRERNI